MPDAHLHCQIDAPIAMLTLDRPDARNAYSPQMVDELVATLDRIELDDAVRCVVLTGAGSCFSAGGDLKLMRDRADMFAGDPVELRNRYLQGILRVPRRMARFGKPIVAAVNGAAIGAGLDLACMCDIRIASERAKFGSTFVKVGLIPGDGGAYFLARTIGLPRALELLLTGRVVDAEKALEIGLAHEVVASDDLMDRARAVADEISANAPLAVQLTRQAAYQSYDLGLEQALQLAASYQSVVQNTDDHLEGVDAILERRPPKFEGS